MPTRLAFFMLALAVCVVVQADSRVLTTGGALDLKIDAAKQVLGGSPGPTLRGTVELSPSPLKPVCDKLVFRVDGEARASEDGAKLVLDTTKLKDGEHSLSIEAERDGKLVLSSGAVAVRVANKSGSAVAAATDEGDAQASPLFAAAAEEGAAAADEGAAPAPPLFTNAADERGDQPSPPFSKVYRALLSHEAIWFRGDEGDLERHSYQTRDRLYLTLTDLIRHIGGRIVWGPKASFIEVTRNGIVLRVIPGSKTVRVNDEVWQLPLPAVVHDGRTYVPARPICEIFGVYVEWNHAEKRAYVYAPQPSYGVELRQYPWVVTDAGYRNYLGAEPASVAFHNYAGLPVHVLMQGNGFRADWQILGHGDLSPVYIAAGTYKLTVWSRQGEDFEDYITVASGVSDRYDISVGGSGHTATLHSH